MSAYGGKADVRELPAVCPLIATSGHTEYLHSAGAFLFGELRMHFRLVLPCGLAGEGQKRHSGLQEKKKPIAALTGEMAGGPPVAQGGSK